MQAARKVFGKEAIAIFVADEEPVASRIVYVNDAFVEMTGYTTDQLVGHSALLLAGAKPSLSALQSALHSPRDEPYVAIERKARRDGSFYDAEVRLEALPRGANASLHVVLTQRELERLVLP